MMALFPLRLYLWRKESAILRNPYEGEEPEPGYGIISSSLRVLETKDYLNLILIYIICW